MPNPVPGTIVPTGALVSPGGNQGAGGPMGPNGPTVVSADAGNIATLGSDNLILVPQSTLWNQRLRSFNSVGNPNFEVDQVSVGNTIASPTSSVKYIDRWPFAKPSTAVLSIGQQAGNVLIPNTNFAISRCFYRLTLTTAQASLGATDNGSLVQTIEGPFWRELMADVHSLSLLVRSSVAGLVFSISLRDLPTVTKSLVKLCTIPTANTWTLIQLPNLPVWPSGNWTPNPGVGAYALNICYAIGSTFIAPAADTWQSGNFLGAPGISNFCASPINSTFDIAFVQHEPGPYCSTLIDKPFTQNYDECLRYYQKTYPYGTAIGTANASGMRSWLTPGANTICFGPASFYKPMAKTPTVTLYNHGTGAANSMRDGAGTDHASATAQAVGDGGFYAVAFATAVTGGMQVLGHYTADTGW